MMFSQAWFPSVMHDFCKNPIWARPQNPSPANSGPGPANSGPRPANSGPGIFQNQAKPVNQVLSQAWLFFSMKASQAWFPSVRRGNFLIVNIRLVRHGSLKSGMGSL